MAVFEGDTDRPYVRKLIADAGTELSGDIDCGGKGALDRDLDGYNLAAQGSPWFVLRDLDHDAACAVSFLTKKKFLPARWMCFRLAVREVESWLLADHEGVADYFRIERRLLPDNPDEEDDPTQTLVNLARKSKSTRVKRAMVPKPGTSASVGPEYEGVVIEFGLNVWDIERASQRSESLRRARRALRSLVERWQTQIGNEEP